MSALSMPVLADNIYAGAGIGRSDYDSPDFGDPTGFNVRAGYQWNKNIGLEGAYVNGGPADDNDGNDSWYIEGDVIQAVVKFSANIEAPVYGYMKVGIGFWDFELDATNTGGGKESEDGSDLIYGAGIGWNFNESGRAFLEYQNLSIDTDGLDGDVSTVSAGIEVRL